MRGKKWLEGCTYLTDADRQRVYDRVEEAKRAFPEHARTVGIRCPSYIGEPHPYAIIEYGPGRRIYAAVYR